MSARQIVVFGIDGEEFGVDIMQVSIIEKGMEIFKIPNTPDFIEGVVNLRDKVITLLNLRKKFGFASRDLDENTRFIIVKEGTNSFGLIVDEVKEILAIDETSIEKAPQTLGKLSGEYITEIIKTDSRIILLLNLNSLLSR
jgi:purine-binding chemotaxis protein CheW